MEFREELNWFAAKPRKSKILEIDVKSLQELICCQNIKRNMNLTCSIAVVTKHRAIENIL